MKRKWGQRGEEIIGRNGKGGQNRKCGEKGRNGNEVKEKKNDAGQESKTGQGIKGKSGKTEEEKNAKKLGLAQLSWTPTQGPISSPIHIDIGPPINPKPSYYSGTRHIQMQNTVELSTCTRRAVSSSRAHG